MIRVERTSVTRLAVISGQPQSVESWMAYWVTQVVCVLHYVGSIWKKWLVLQVFNVAVESISDAWLVVNLIMICRI